MKALSCTQPGTFDYIDKEMPAMKDGYTSLKIMRVGICGTDYHAFDGTQPYFSYPRILGHEIAAEISATNADGFHNGDIVTISPYFYCGHCIACLNGKTNCCQTMQVCGVHIDGAMCEYILVPDYALVEGRGLTADELVLVEPLAIGAHGVRRADVKPGEFVLVIGAGPIGLGTMDFAKIAGAEVIAMDVNTHRLEFCREKLGIHHLINPLTENALERLQYITNGNMPTVVMDCTGNLKAINNAFQYMAHGARFVMIGLQKGEISFSHPDFHKREATLMSSRNALPADFAHVIDCIKSKRVQPADYITHKLDFYEVKDQFPALVKPDSGVIKAILHL
ncbi:MAG: zinc-binding alcohol dehydrogenase family protein [Pedobacter sp.]|nr:MAG: zinc-binding alcohol dehydrogenase family protein [Pedobacter sp.]